MISQAIIRGIEKSTKSLFHELGLDYGDHLKINVEQPTHLEYGDYSTNIAMQLAKVLRKAPMQIAELLKTELEKDGHIERLVKKIEIAPPGFINMYLNWGEWAQKSFILPIIPKDKVVIEHTSINPNKSAHIGHLRNSCIGDALVRLLKRVGYNVEVHNYIDDLGNQLADTVVGMLNVSHKKEHSRFGDFCWDVYAQVNKEYEQNPQLMEQRTKVLHSLEESNENLAWMGLLIAERIVREHLEEMKAFNISYDLLVWESNIVREGFWDSAFSLLKKHHNFIKKHQGNLKDAGY